MAEPSSRDGKQGKCPICGAQASPLYRPFCSRRCADVDLSRWLRGTYAIAGEADDKAASSSQDEDDDHATKRGPS